MSDLSETLLQAIDVVAKERFRQLPYDKTLKCTIVDVAEAEKGIYYVNTQGIIMTAFSERTDYKKNDEVYVTVPCGNFSDKKIIVGKVITIPEELVTYRPFDLYAPVSENLNINYGKGVLDEFTLTPNKNLDREIFSKSFYPEDMKKYAGYDYLGIKLSIAARIPNAVSGAYQIKIILNYIDQTEQSTIEFNAIQPKDIKTEEYAITFDDMIAINYYNTAGYNLQEKVFSVKNKIIKSIKIFIDQTKDFLDEDDNRFVIDSYYIKTKDLQCTLGYSISPSLIEGDAQLYSYTYDGYNYDENHTSKHILSRLVRYERGVDNNIIGIIQPETSLGNIKWTRNISTDKGDVLENLSLEKMSEEIKLNPVMSNIETQYIIQGIFLGNKLTSNKIIFKNNEYITTSEMVILLSQEIKDLKRRITILESK